MVAKNIFLRKLTALLLVTVMLMGLPSFVFAADVQDSESQNEQEDSRAIDDPVQDYYPPDGDDWTLLFSITAESVSGIMLSTEKDSTKRFKRGDLPETANWMRITGELNHSLNSDDAVIRVGICYPNWMTGDYDPAYCRDIDSGSFDYTFSISEYLTSSTRMYYLYVKNLEGQGHVEGNVYLYYY